MNCQEETHSIGEGENRQEHVALYVFDEQVEEGAEEEGEEEQQGEGKEEQNNREEEGNEEQQADNNMQNENPEGEENNEPRDNEEQQQEHEEEQGEKQEEENDVDDDENRQDEMQFEEMNQENNENNAEEKGQEQQLEQEQHEEQPQMKLTMELLWKPDDETKKLFAEVDLEEFLDKAKKDLTEAGEDPRSAYIDFVALCSGDETLKSKISLDVLLQYPFWRYRIGEERVLPLLEEEDKKKLEDSDGKVLSYNSFMNMFHVFPHLPESNEILTVKDNEDLKYLVEKEKDGDGLGRLADMVKFALSKGVKISIIDLSDVNMANNSEYYLNRFAGLPVSFRGKWLETVSEESTDRPGVRVVKNSEDILLVSLGNGTFKVRYEPSDIYATLGCRFVGMENLKEALKEDANTFGEELGKAIESLELTDFLRKPIVINNDGTVKGCSRKFLSKFNKQRLYDLVNGEGMSGSVRNSWSEFLGKLKSFDPKYYKSLILFFLHWDGSDRVDFSAFSKGNFDNWQKSLNITYGCVLENLKVQEIWNRCLDEVADIPNKDAIKAMFGNLKALFESDEYMPGLGIAESERIKMFLNTIEDWEEWDGLKNLYVTKKGHGYGSERQVACYTRDDWKNYQKWRFELYFLKRKKSLASKTNPIEACEQGYADWEKICRWEEDL